MHDVIVGLQIPLAGTVGGGLCFLHAAGAERHIAVRHDRIRLGRDGGGVRVEPADPRHGQSGKQGWLSFLPAVTGFLLGIMFLLLLDTT